VGLWARHEKAPHFLFLGLYLCLRAPFLASIPPYTADEGLLALAAKNWVVFGDPFLDGWNNLARFPLYTFWLTALFRVVGVSILAARASAIVFGAISLLLLIRLAGRISPSQRTVAALLFASDFVLVRYQRYALAESLQILLLLATVSLWIDRRRTVRFLGGIGLAAALCVKATSAYLVVPLLVYDLWLRKGRSAADRPARVGPWGRFGPYAVAALVTGVVYGVAYHATPVGARDVWGIYGRLSLPGFSDLPHLVASLGGGTPLVALGSVLALMKLGRRTGRGEDGSTRSPELAIALAWVVAGLALLLPQRLHPVRYYVTLLPAAILLASWWLDQRTNAGRAGTDDPVQLRRRQRTRRAVLAAGVCYPIILFAWYYGPGGGSDSSARKVDDYVRANVPRESVLMGRAQYGIDIPNRYRDMTVSGGMALSDSLLARLGVDWVLFDDTEWRQIDRRLALGTAEYLAANGTFVRRVGQVEIWRVGRR
jgi:4-amino-4-deoxy-L-arabinose transferase-like glycosyltransferase